MNHPMNHESINLARAAATGCANRPSIRPDSTNHGQAMSVETFEILKQRLANYCNVNAFDLAGLKEDLHGQDNVELNAIFRAQLREAIDAGILSTEDYERLTGEDFDTDDDLRDLLHGIFAYLYEGCTP